MARTREFDTTKVLNAVAAVFQKHGYEGSSIEKLVIASGLPRGSIYQAFGSKSGLFRETMKHVLQKLEDGSVRNLAPIIDLIIVAMWDRSKEDREVRAVIEVAIPLVEDISSKNFNQLAWQQIEKRSRIHL